MSVVISKALEQLFTLRDQRTAIIEQFILAEAELQANMQQNAGKEFVEVQDLEVAQQLLQPVLKFKKELETVNTVFEEKKGFFITLLEASGCHKLFCTNREKNSHGQPEDVSYIVYLSRNMEGLIDLAIQQKTL